MKEIHYFTNDHAKKVSMFLGHSELENLPKRLKLLNFDKVVIITDSHIKRVCFNKLESKLKGQTYKVFSFEAGEASKQLKTYELLANQIFNWGITKRSLLIAFGGGVVGNIGGFLASTLHRGIKLVHIPTTVMAMADSTTGGKQGVNTKHGKNLLGTFYQPEFILIDFSLLETLSDRHITNGIAECIKHALCQNKETLSRLTQMGIQGKPQLNEIIASTIQQKLEILNQDPKEQGVGKILIYGHTIGHALEFLSEGKLLHGEAISIGMCFAARLSNILGIMPDSEVDKHYEAFHAWGLPTSIPKEFDTDSILELLRHDKKHKKAALEFVLLESIGKAYKGDGSYSLPVDTTMVKSVLQGMY
jgi:3-dehydroquinate synthase